MLAIVNIVALSLNNESLAYKENDMYFSMNTNWTWVKVGTTVIMPRRCPECDLYYECNWHTPWCPFYNGNG